MSISAVRIAIFLLILFSANGPAASQQCDGVEMAVGADTRRCLRPGSGERFRDCVDCPEMVVVPAGQFMMGSPQDEPEREAEREQQVRINIERPFAIGAYAVTRKEFAAFVAATGHKLDESCYFWTGTTWEERPDRSWQSPGFAQDDSHPVTCVDLSAAKAYVAWLSGITGQVYRLPSETEREYATRAGTTTTFWWGGSISTDIANYDGTKRFERGRSASGVSERFLSTASSRTPGVSSICTATYGTGRTIAGTRATREIPETAA